LRRLGVYWAGIAPLEAKVECRSGLVPTRRHANRYRGAVEWTRTVAPQCRRRPFVPMICAPPAVESRGCRFAHSISSLQSLVFLAHRLFDSGLRRVVPTPGIASFAGAHRNSHSAKNVSAACPLLKRQFLAAFYHCSTCAKFALVRTFLIGHPLPRGFHFAASCAKSPAINVSCLTIAGMFLRLRCGLPLGVFRISAWRSSPNPAHLRAGLLAAFWIASLGPRSSGQPGPREARTRVLIRPRSLKQKWID
jgi:hypothetical protein